MTVKITLRSHGAIVECEKLDECDAVEAVIHRSQDEEDLMAKFRNSSSQGQARVIKCTYANMALGYYVVVRDLITPIENHLKRKSMPFEITEASAYLGKDIDVDWTFDLKLRIDQVPVNDFLVENTGGPLDASEFLIGASPGSGKTLMSLNYCFYRSKRFACIMRPGYLSQWKGEILKKTTIKKDEIFSLDSKNAFKRLAKEIKKSTCKIKCIMISNTVYDRWIKRFLHVKGGKLRNKHINWEDVLDPTNIFQMCGIDTVIADEVHKDLRFWHSFKSFAHLPCFIGLSGTFVSRDNFIRKIQEQIFPTRMRFETLKRKPYINYVRFWFNLSFPTMKIANRGMGTVYSQTAYEESIWKNQHVKIEFFELIDKALRYTYSSQLSKDPKRMFRALVFLGLVKLGKEFADYCKAKNKDLVVNSYHAGDDFSLIEESNIIISTPSKASTALDIDSLISVVDATNTNSLQDSIQRLLRLRLIETPTCLTYTQMNNTAINKHKRYQLQRDKDLKDYLRYTYDAYG